MMIQMLQNIDSDVHTDASPVQDNNNAELSRLENLICIKK